MGNFNPISRDERPLSGAIKTPWESLQEEIQKRMTSPEGAYTPQQRKLIEDLNNSATAIMNDRTLTPRDKTIGMNRVRGALANMPMPGGGFPPSPYPKGKRDGDVWVDPQLPGVALTRKDGAVSVLRGQEVEKQKLILDTAKTIMPLAMPDGVFDPALFQQIMKVMGQVGGFEVPDMPGGEAKNPLPAEILALAQKQAGAGGPEAQGAASPQVAQENASGIPLVGPDDGRELPPPPPVYNQFGWEVAPPVAPSVNQPAAPSGNEDKRGVIVKEVLDEISRKVQNSNVGRTVRGLKTDPRAGKAWEAVKDLAKRLGIVSDNPDEVKEGIQQTKPAAFSLAIQKSTVDELETLIDQLAKELDTEKLGYLKEEIIRRIQHEGGDE